jgi:hypothetical protein
MMGNVVFFSDAARQVEHAKAREKLKLRMDAINSCIKTLKEAGYVEKPDSHSFLFNEQERLSQLLRRSATQWITLADV